MRRNLAISLFVVALLSLVVWAISNYVQPILPQNVNNNLLIFGAVFIAVIGALAGLKDIIELYEYVFSGNRQNKKNQNEIIQKLQRKGLEDDLHELINWYHSGVVLYLDALSDMLINGKYEQAKEIMPEILQRAHSTVNELRMIHTSIISKILEEEQFSEALRSLVSIWARRASPINYGQMAINVECPENIELPLSITEPILRIATSAITNAIFYSGIIHDLDIIIRIIVEKTEKQLTIRIYDDGIGTDIIVEGFGIARMKNIVQELNNAGTTTYLDISSKRGKGTQVTLRVAI